MAITNYSELQTAITDWMARSDIQGSAVDFITLAEARLNRLLGTVSTDVALTGTENSRRISLSALSIVKPIALHMTDPSSREELLIVPRTDGSFSYSSVADQPSFWAIEGTNIDFDCPLDQAYSFRLTYQGRFALSEAAPSNELLANHPDVYLAAAIVWGAVYVKDAAGMQWKAMLDEFILETRSTFAQSKRSTLTVDPVLVRPRGYNFYQDVSS